MRAERDLGECSPGERSVRAEEEGDVRSEQSSAGFADDKAVTHSWRANNDPVMDIGVGAAGSVRLPPQEVSAGISYLRRAQEEQQQIRYTALRLIAGRYARSDDRRSARHNFCDAGQ